MDGQGTYDNTFEEWCSEYGSDPDSRSAYRTFQACIRADGKLRRVLGAEALTELYDQVEGR